MNGDSGNRTQGEQAIDREGELIQIVRDILELIAVLLELIRKNEGV